MLVIFENFIKSSFLISIGFLLMILINSYDSKKKVLNYLKTEYNINENDYKLISYDKTTGKVIIKDFSNNQTRELSVPVPIKGSNNNDSAGLSKAKSFLSKQITNELKEHFVKFGNVRDLNMREKLLNAKTKLDYFNDWMIDPDTQTYHRSFIADDDIEKFTGLSKSYIERIQIELLDAIQRDLGATTQQVEERKILNQIATKIKEMLNNVSPSPRYRNKTI